MLNIFSLKRLLKITLIISLIIAAVYFYNYFEIGKLATRENIEQYLKPFGNWIPLVYLTIFLTAMICYVPASVFLVTIGTLLGPLWGSFWGIVGLYLASGIIFFTARKIGAKSVQARLGDNWEKFNSKIEEDGFFYLALIRSTSLFPFSVIAYASAITSIKPVDYIKGTLIGCIPQILIFCYIVPMVISQNISLKNIFIVSISTISWMAVFGLVYSFHKRQKSRFSDIVTE